MTISAIRNESAHYLLYQVCPFFDGFCMPIAPPFLDDLKEGNPWAIEHVAQRVDGRVREQVEVTTNTNVKVRYESYEEVRAALLEEGINVDQLPLLTDMRPPEGQERN
jgi:hypothetical protein